MFITARQGELIAIFTLTESVDQITSLHDLLVGEAQWLLRMLPGVVRERSDKQCKCSDPLLAIDQQHWLNARSGKGSVLYPDNRASEVPVLRPVANIQDVVP